MDPYLDALNAMHDLLGALGEKHWRAWIAKDIREWERRKSVQHHLLAYGGMGSFNDIVFDDVWLNALFEDLRSACYYFARQPTFKPDIQALKGSMSKFCPSCGSDDTAIYRWLLTDDGARGLFHHMTICHYAEVRSKCVGIIARFGSSRD